MEEIEISPGIFLTAEGLAVFKKLKLAAAADLHIGFEEAFGEQLARMQTKMILEKFQRVFKRFNLSEVLLDGDIKYSFGKESKQEWNEIHYFMTELKKHVQIRLIKGNHDFYLENMVRDFDLQVMHELEMNGIVFTHGEDEIDKAALKAKSSKTKLTVIGNEHPSVKLRDEIGASRKYPCFLYAEKERILVLPAANPWAPGTDVMGVHARHFRSPLLRKINLEKARVYALDGQQIYDFKKVGDIRKLLAER